MIDHNIQVDDVEVLFSTEPRKEAIIKAGKDKRIVLSKKEWNNLRLILRMVEFRAQNLPFGF